METKKVTINLKQKEAEENAEAKKQADLKAAAKKHEAILAEIQTKKKKTEAAKENLRLAVLSLFVFLLLTGFLLIMFMPKPTTSEYERRELATFPKFSIKTLFSGEYTSAINVFIADTFPFRDKLVEAGAYFDDMKGVRRNDVKIYGSAPSAMNDDNATELPKPFEPEQFTRPTETQSSVLPNENTPIVNETQPTVTESFDDFPDDPNAVGEQNGNVFVLGDTGMDLFGGTKANGESYANILNAYRSLISNDINIYSMLVPTHSEFALPKKYRDMARSQKDGIEYIDSFLADGITVVNIYDTLYHHKNEYIYFRTDHHWTALGAHYAYEEFGKAAGFNAVPLEDLQTARINEFLGSFYTSTQDLNLKNNPDYIDVYYPPDVDVYKTTQLLEDGTLYYPKLVYTSVSNISAGYIAFGADVPYSKIVTPNKNGKRLLVFKESYGNAFIPFAALNYEEVHVADIRFFPYNAVEFIETYGITDVLFINNIFAAYTTARIADIENILR